MSIDPIVDELHRQRAEEMERFKFDFDAFFRHLKDQETLSKRPVISPPESSADVSVQRTRATGRR